MNWNSSTLFLSQTLNMVLFAEALSEATAQGIYEKTTLL